MIKPDYITFSQEEFDECENLRIRLLADDEFGRTDEYKNEAMRLYNLILGNEYGRYLDEIQSRKK